MAKKKGKKAKEKHFQTSPMAETVDVAAADAVLAEAQGKHTVNTQTHN